MTAPTAGGGGELGTVFINVAPKLSGLSNQFLAAGREGAKSFSQGFTEGMKQVSLPADGSILGEVIAGKPVGTATRSAAQKAGKEIGTGLNTGISEGMKTAPSNGGGAISDVIAGKPVGSGTKAAAENVGKEIGAGINKGVAEAAKTGPKLGDIITEQTAPEETGTRLGSRIGGALKDAMGGAISGMREQLSGDIGSVVGKVSTGLSTVEDLAGKIGIDLSAWKTPAADAAGAVGGMDDQMKDVLAKVTEVSGNFTDMPGKIGAAASKMAVLGGEIGGVIALLQEAMPYIDQMDQKIHDMGGAFQWMEEHPPSTWPQWLADKLGARQSREYFRSLFGEPPPPDTSGTIRTGGGIEPFPQGFIGPIPPGAVRAPGGVPRPVLPPPPPPGFYRDWYGGGTPPAETPAPREPREPRAPSAPRGYTGGSSLRSRALSGAGDRGGVAAAGSRVANLYALAESLVGTPYSTALRDDCSGIVAELAAVAVGLPVPGPGERFSTVTEEDWLLSHGFRMGMGPPGSLRIGWTPLPGMEGHTAATLPGGEHAEMGGTHGGFVLGAGAAGAESPQFSMHAYLPMGGGRGGAPLGTEKDPIYTSSTEGEGKGGADQYGQQLGQSIVSGMFQELGFPDVFGKPFTQWGAWKMGMAGLNYGMGLAQMMGGPAGGGAAGGGFGGFHGVPSIVGMAAQAASQRPGAQPLGAPGAPGNTQILNFDLSGGVGRVESGAVKSVQDAVNPAGGGSAATATVGGAQGQPG
jgi:hypothetical protein